MKKNQKIPLTTPGEILLEEFVKPLQLTLSSVADAIFIPVSRLSEIIHGKRAITADTAYRLGLFLGTSSEFWLNLQNHYDLQCLAESRSFGSIKPFKRRTFTSKPRGRRVMISA